MPPPPEFFIDRNFGKQIPRRLREAGWRIHLIADFYPDDGEHIGDSEWIAEGCRRNWVPLCKDGRIIGRDHEFQPVLDHKAVLFYLNNQQLNIQQMFDALHGAHDAIHRALTHPGPAAYAITRYGKLIKKRP
ncbi:toxin-antitoxin system, toxin component, PIN family protein [Streptomyces sp. NPDC058045]|uniref:PIN-like domain-containing protein n=1 Tax=Streptomyces sp. NPDC058045 TaxID=3346311 RepID=UPI0036EED50B